MTHFVELIDNVRALSNNGEKSPLAKVCTNIRIGKVDGNEVDVLNTRIVNSPEQAANEAHPDAVWITSTHEKVKKINKMFMRRLNSKGKVTRRIIAKHVPIRKGVRTNR